MNKKRKTRFQDVIVSLEEAKDELYDIQDEEQESFDSLPEGLQSSDRGEGMLEWIDMIEEFIGDIDTVIEDITEKTK